MSERIDLLGDWLVRTSIEGSVLIAVALGLSWLLGRHLAPRWRVTLWALVGFKLLIPAFSPAAPGLGNWLWTTSSPEAPVSLPSPSRENVELNPPVPASILAPESPDASAALLPRAVSSLEPKPVLSPGYLLFLLWLTGAAVVVASVFIRQQRFASRVRLTPCRDRHLLTLVRGVANELGLRRNIHVMLSPEGSTPAAYGVRRSCLLLPRDCRERFDSDTLRYIVMHEMEHIRYRDVLLNWVAAAVNAVHWFNPLVWIAASRFQSDRELRCDAETLSRLKPTERIDYGRTLLRVQKEFLPAPAIAGVAPCVRNHPTLHQRILMITNPTERKTWLNAILALGFAGLFLVSFGSAAADEERPPRESDKPADRKADGPVREGEREREGDRKREGDRTREGDRPDHEGNRPEIRAGDIRVVVLRDGVLLGNRRVQLANLREELGHHKGHGAVIFAQPDVPFHLVNTVSNALKSSGIHDVRIGGIEGGDRPRPEGVPRDGDRPRPEGVPRDGDRPRPEGVPRDGDRPRPEGAPRDGDRPRPEGVPRDGDRPRPEGAPRDGDRPRPEGVPRDGDRPRPEGVPRDGDRPRPEGVPRDGDRPRPEGAPRDGDRPRPEGVPRDGDRPRPEGAPRDGEKNGDEGV